MPMTVSQLILALGQIPAQDAIVNVDEIDATGALPATPAPDGPRAGGDPDPGVVELSLDDD